MLSDPLLFAVFLAAIGVTALSLLLLAVVAALRLQLLARERRLRRVIARWQPLLARTVAGERFTVPRLLSATERELVLPLWNEVRESIRGEAEARLDALARRARLDRTARAMLASRGPRKQRILAINTAGYLLADECWDRLLALCRDPNPTISLTAVRAVMRADPARALPELLPLMLARENWSLVHLVPLLRATDAGFLAGTLERALERTAGGERVRLLRLAEALPPDRSSAWARKILDAGAAEPVIEAALRLVRDPRDAPLVRRYLEHPGWQVRVRAIGALEHVAGAEDVARLVAALGDREWWVRMRAARTLVRLPILDEQELARLRDGVTDRFGRDALAHAEAEERAP